MKKGRKKWAIIRIAITFSFLFLIWLLFSSTVDAYSLVIGFIGSLSISLFTYNIFIPLHQLHFRYVVANPFFLIAFLLLLIPSIYIASFKMLGAVLKGKSRPKIVHFRTRIRSDIGRMLLALSITLTPGTICIDVNDDHLVVHWFLSSTSHNKEAGEKIKGRMEHLIGRIFL